MKSRQQQKQKLTLTALALALFATATSGCGQQSFEVSSSQAAISAPGVFTIPAKVDILLAQDDSGSMIEPYNQLVTQVPSFLQGLDSTGWDYHFATVPLTYQTGLTQIVAGHYDANWMPYGGWISPFPGATPDFANAIPSNLFVQAGSYIDPVYPSSTTGSEPGLENLTETLESTQAQMGNSNFLRPDAMLVVVVMGNGDDTSGAQTCYRSDHLPYACNMTPTSNFATRLRNLKGGVANQVKFYAAVSTIAGQNCYGSPSYQGSRYMSTASLIGGGNIDLCQNSVSSVLNKLSSNLQTVRVGFRTHYIFISQHPDPSSITVTKYVNGAPTVLPQNATNGWTYVGDVQNVYAIDYPTNMNLSSGIAIRLNGSAELSGTDTATVDYTVNGLHNSN